MKPENVVGLAFVVTCGLCWVAATVVDALRPAFRPVRHVAPIEGAAADRTPGTHDTSADREREDDAYGLSACRHGDDAGVTAIHPGAPAGGRPFVVRCVSVGAPGTSGGIEIAELAPLYVVPWRRDELN
jgi:hypothetical protein